MADQSRMLNFMATPLLAETLKRRAAALGESRSEYVRRAVETRFSTDAASTEHAAFADRVGLVTTLLSDVVELRAKSHPDDAAQACRLVAAHLLRYAEQVTNATEHAAFLIDEVTDLPARLIKSGRTSEVLPIWAAILGRITAEAKTLDARLVVKDA